MRNRFFRAGSIIALFALSACQFGPGPIEQMAIDNMKVCNETHDQTACAQWTYAAPLVAGERDRITQENNQKTQGFLGAAIAGLGAAAVLSH